MLLAVDIGNSQVKLGLASAAGSVFDRVWRVATVRDRTPDEWHVLLANLFAAGDNDVARLTDIAIASVVPAATRWLATMSRERLSIEPLVLVSQPVGGLRVATDQPSETGIDRVVNAFAAFSAHGGPVVVVDAG